MSDSAIPDTSFDIVAYCTRKSDGSAIVIADVQSMTYSIWDMETGLPVATNVSLPTSGVIFDTLQPDSRFPLGYNFRWSVPTLPPDNKSYAYRVQIVLSDGAKLPVYYERTSPSIGAP